MVYKHLYKHNSEKSDVYHLRTIHNHLFANTPMPLAPEPAFHFATCKPSQHHHRPHASHYPSAIDSADDVPGGQSRFIPTRQSFRQQRESICNKEQLRRPSTPPPPPPPARAKSPLFPTAKKQICATYKTCFIFYKGISYIIF